MKYERTYTAKPCQKCSEIIAAPKGLQRYCEPCATTCSVSGCSNVVRAKDLCAAHTGVRFEVTAIPSRGGHCGVEGCEREWKLKGVCQFHYDRFYKTGDFGDAGPRQRVARGAPCLVDGCETAGVARGYCMKHYARFKKRGHTGEAALERAEQGTGSITESGYRKIKTPTGYEFEHRLVMAKMIGRPLREGENVHHRDGDRLNNAPANLELWIVQQPAGQRLEDRIEAAKALLTRHGITHEVFSQHNTSSGLLSFGA